MVVDVIVPGACSTNIEVPSKYYIMLWGGVGVRFRLFYCTKVCSPMSLALRGGGANFYVLQDKLLLFQISRKKRFM